MASRLWRKPRVSTTSSGSFALVLFTIVLFLGLATYVRIVQINLEEIHLVGAMNRLRRAYADSAPEVRDYFTSGVR